MDLKALLSRFIKSDFFFILYILFFILLLFFVFYGDMLHFRDKFTPSSRTNVNEYSSNQIYVVDPQVINSSMKAYLYKKYKKVGSPGVYEEFGLGDRTISVISTLSNGHPVFIKQSVISCGIDNSLCIDLTESVLEKMGFEKKISSVNILKEQEMVTKGQIAIEHFRKNK